MSTIITFLFFTTLVAVITWYITKKDNHTSSDGYFLGGRTLTAGYIAGSLMLTNLSTEQLVGLNGSAFRNGLSVMAWEVIATIALIIMAMFFLPIFLKSGISTIPQFLEERFNSTTKNITSFIFIIAYAVILLPLILYTGATGMVNILNMESITGLSYVQNIIIVIILIALIGASYAIFGGLRTVAVSDTINGFGLLIGGVSITYLSLKYINNDQSIITTYNHVINSIPDKFNSISMPEGDVPFYTLFSGVFLLNLFYWCTNQQIIQRTFGASSLAEGQKGVLLAGFLKLLGPVILVIPGLIAFYMYKEGILNIPLDDNGIPKSDTAYGLLVQTVMPKWLTGFFSAVLLGAILSSFNSVLNSTCTIFSLEIYKGLINKNADDSKIIDVSKKFGWIITFSSMLIAPLLLSQQSIFSYLQKMNAIYFVPVFSVVIVGILTKKVPAIAANIGLIFSFVIICIVYFVPSLDITDKNSPIFIMHNFHFISVVLFLSVILMLIIGKIKPLEKEYVQKYSGAVNMQEWKYTKLVSTILFITVIFIYILFADISVIGEVSILEKLIALMFIAGTIISVLKLNYNKIKN